MYRGPVQTADKTKRVYLRISANRPGRIFVENKFFKKVFINDLSASGVGFFIAGQDLPANSFELRFRLGPLSPVIRAQVTVRNRSEIHGGFRLGCSIDKIFPREQKAIVHYLCRYTDYWPPCQAVNMAAFFCILDVMLRIGLWVFIRFYEVTRLGRSLVSALLVGPEAFFYVFYALFSLAAFFLSDVAFVKRGVKFLALAIICLIPSLMFVAAKCFEYWKLGLFFSNMPFVQWFCFGFGVLFVFIAVAVVNSTLSLRTIVINIRNEKMHRAHL
jgi:hypothetical protein